MVSDHQPPPAGNWQTNHEHFPRACKDPSSPSGPCILSRYTRKTPVNVSLT